MTIKNKILFIPCDDTTGCVGMSLQGHITASFAELCEMFGKPAFEGKGDKVTTEFAIDFEWYDNDDEVHYGGFVLYDWHYGRNFNDDYEQITWNVGARSWNDGYAATIAKKIFDETDVRYAYDDFYAACLAHATWHDVQQLDEVA